ncbi:MAG: YraN family protein [Acidobacteriaceae bacterium]|nr:YraN family protein [Acidobacteriaceae bacterium]
MRWTHLQAGVLRRLDWLSARLGRGQRDAAHLRTGLRGEREALFHLRGLGYTVVARRWKTPRLRGDIDLVAWDGGWLCFVEVKTRGSRGIVSAEAAIDEDKQIMLRRMARAYLRGFPGQARDRIPVRFDVVSVYLLPSGSEFEVNRGAFPWAES